jgi:hypothetical protein
MLAWAKGKVKTGCRIALFYPQVAVEPDADALQAVEAQVDGPAAKL